MNVVHYARTPVAGAAYQIWRCLDKYTDLNVRLINEIDRYKDGRVFPSDLVVSNSLEVADIIKNADVIHIHNYLPFGLSGLIDKSCQKVIATLHSVPRLGNWQNLVTFADEVYCIRQPYQQREYQELKSLPTLFDIFEHDPNPDKSFDKIRIVFAPSTRVDSSHPSSKAYDKVFPILQALNQEQDIVEFILLEGRPYFDNLEIKRNCHIIIDDIISHHQTFHLTSIEGASFGLVGITSIGSPDFPFIESNFSNLKSILVDLIHNIDKIKELGYNSRKWMEENWNPKIQVEEYLKIYQK